MTNARQLPTVGSTTKEVLLSTTAAAALATGYALDPTGAGEPFRRIAVIAIQDPGLIVEGTGT